MQQLAMQLCAVVHLTAVHPRIERCVKYTNVHHNFHSRLHPTVGAALQQGVYASLNSIFVGIFELQFKAC